jgi:hypothetical protein
MALIKCPECSKEVSDRAPTCPSCGVPIAGISAEPKFDAYHQRVLIGSLILCIIGLPIGFALNLPSVWGLALAGILIAGVKLFLIKR